ncbi:hypothetical protein RDABS01_023671 [Bienertia sinuspersici]
MKTRRKSLVEERYDRIKNKHMRFIKMVEERAANMRNSLVPFLPNDLIFTIFLLLPVKSLLRFTCVCKAWYKLIYCAEFVEAYNTQAQTTPILFRYRGVDEERPNTYHVEIQLKQSENFSFFPYNSGFERSKFIHFLEIEDEKCKLVDLNMSLFGSVVATCNGLILINSVNEVFGNHTESSIHLPLVDSQENLGRLIVMNPMTRKSIGFPLGTLPNGHDKESYGLMFSQKKGVYKVVHLFKDNFGYINCEILSLQTRSWKAVDKPPSTLFRSLGQPPISTTEALYWLPGSTASEYIISMGVDDERFSEIDLPTTLRKFDRLVEMGGSLVFVKNLNKNQIEVWVLKALERPEWVKQYTIRTDVFVFGDFDNEYYFEPAFALNAKEMVFRRKERLYSYNFELEELREINMDPGRITANETIMPHSNNLATWEALEPIR